MTLDYILYDDIINEENEFDDSTSNDSIQDSNENSKNDEESKSKINENLSSKKITEENQNSESSKPKVTKESLTQSSSEEIPEEKLVEEDLSEQLTEATLSKDEVTDQNSEKEELESNNTNNKVNFPHLIGKKIGMTQIYLNNGKCIPSTVLEVGPCKITQIKTNENDGYNAVQLGYFDLKKSKILKSQSGHFAKSKTTPKKYLKEFRYDNIDHRINLGDDININQFDIGDLISVSGYSKGKGFTGHMKRHGFSGGRRSHGKNSVMRKAGSIGAGSDPSRVFPGMKMAGRKGNDKTSIKNLSIVKMDKNNNLLFVKGSVPGGKNGLIYLSKIL